MLRDWSRVGLAALAGLGLVFAALNLYVAVPLRQADMDRGLRELGAIVDLHTDRIERTLAHIELSLDNLRARAAAERPDGREMHTALRQSEQSLPLVRVIGVTDATGRIVHSSRSLPPPGVSIGDRDYIAYFIEGGRERRYLSGPIRNVVDDRWQVSLALPIRREDGTLAGVISAVLDLLHLVEMLSRNPAESDYLTLLYTDFRLIARSPLREDMIGRPLGDAELYRKLAASPSGRVAGVFANYLTGEIRLAVARRLYGDQLVISTSRPLADVLGPWRALMTAVATASALVLGLLALLVRTQAQRVREEHARSDALGALNEELRRQTERAERLAAVKSDFLASMSHEIRTPMNGVLGMAQVLARMDLPPRVRDGIAVIVESAQNLLAIVNDILDLTKIEAGRLVLRPEETSLRDLCSSLQGLFEPSCEAKGVEFYVEVDPDVPDRVVLDSTRFRQILINLLGNAVKFTDQGEIRLAIRLLRREGETVWLRVAVLDTGAGISDGALETIFDRFTQDEDAAERRVDGAGLGLAISKRLVELLGGTIGCESVKGRGSTFWIELPVAATLAAPTGAGSRERLAETAATAQPRPAAVLCVDDNAVNLRLLEAIFEPLQVDVTTATNGAAAIRAASEKRFDLVLLDIHMPGMSGLEVKERIDRLFDGRPRPAIYAITADAMRESVDRYRAAGFDGVVTKPFDIAEIEAILGALRHAGGGAGEPITPAASPAGTPGRP